MKARINGPWLTIHYGNKVATRLPITRKKNRKVYVYLFVEDRGLLELDVTSRRKRAIVSMYFAEFLSANYNIQPKVYL